jgi:PAS domain S-box-containing protein
MSSVELAAVVQSQLADDKAASLLIDEVFDQVPEPILLVDKASRAPGVNQEFIRMFGYLQKDIIGRTVASFVVLEELPKEAERFADLIAQGHTVETVRMPEDSQRIDVSLLPAKLQAFPLVPRTLLSYHWNLSLGQVVESTQTLNVSCVGAAGQR